MKVIINYNKLSEFQQTTEIKSADSFIISHPKSNNDYVTYKLNYTELSSQLLSIDISNCPFSLTGDWKFSKAPIINEFGTVEMSAAINMEIFNDLIFSNYIIPLSAQLYGNNDQLKLPSYVGQVIVSDTLTSESAVKRIYGGTSWKQIKGRFLFGAGDNESNTSNEYGEMGSNEIGISKSMKTGGTNVVTLSKNNIPPHSHTFKDGNHVCKYGTIPKKLIEVPGEITTEATYGVVTNGSVQSSRFGGSEGSPDYHHKAQSHHKIWKGLTKGTWHATDSGEYADASQFSMAGELVEGQTFSKSVNFKAKGDINDSTNTIGAPHNNMPPYVGKYIWERTA